MDISGDICASVRNMAEATAAQIESILSGVISEEQSTSSVVATSLATFPKIVHPIEEPQLSQHELTNLQIALNTQKVSEISKAILGVEALEIGRASCRERV